MDRKADNIRHRAWGLAVAAFSALAFPACGDGGESGPTDTCDPTVRRANLDCEDATVQRSLLLLRALSLEEKVQQMSGPAYNPNNMFDQEENGRARIPGFKYMDGPRGVRWYNSDYGTTVFPVAAGRAASFNLELEKKIGKVMADEMRYMGRHILLAPTVNQVTHPRWGRAQETYGEDSFLLGEMGAAFVEGAQYDPKVADPADPSRTPEDTYRIQACVKHLAANNIEDTRIYVNAVMDERTLREVYLPHFKKAIDKGVACVMTSYNRVNGSYAGYSKEIVRQILKTEWKYNGYVISDWFAKGNTLSSPEAGLDIEMPFSSGTFPSLFDSAYFYGALLTNAVNNGLVSERYIDEAAMRIIHNKVKFGVVDYTPGWKPYLTKSEDSQELALEAARQSVVMLKNGPTRALSDDVLPLDPAAINRIAVVGKFANSENMGDKGSSDAKVVDGALVITPFEGVRDYFAGPGKTVVTFEEVAGNESSVQSADVVVVVGAYFYADLARSSSGEEGEWKDRVSLQLPARDLANLNAVKAMKATNPDMKIVVVLKSGGAVVVKDWVDDVDAILHTWFGGMKEGEALAEILFGDTVPSGRLVQSVPVDETDLPAFDNTNLGDVVYDYYHGYRWFDRKAIKPQYPFGFGLSYTTFAYDNLEVVTPTVAADGTLSVKVDVTNTGPVAGSEVVQLYVGFGNTAVNDSWKRSVKELKGFERVENLAPGETRTVQIDVPVSELAYWDTAGKKWVVEAMVHELFVGPSADADDPDTQTGSFTVN